MTPEPAGFGVYVHWPFCKAKCPYCDFNSHVRERIDEAAWGEALVRALDAQAPPLLGRTVGSIFFGGGTPSLMAPATVGRILDRIARHWTLATDVEITLEANPTSVEASRFQGYRAAGVNRVSLGVQSLLEADLAFLGRQHDASEARAAVRLAASIFPRHSLDLIYARPNQTPAGWAAELAAALELAGDHISLYQLTIEAGTAFQTRFDRGDFRLPDDDLGGEMYELTQAILEAAGFPAYEISNHARPGGESRHNLVYWRYGDYLGVGPGAHGRLTIDGDKRATRQHKAPETWLAAIARGDGMAETVPVSVEDRLTEMLMMGLRLAAPIPRGRFLREIGKPPETALPAASLAKLIGGGFLTLDARGLGATPAGRQRLDAVLATLLAG